MCKILWVLVCGTDLLPGEAKLNVAVLVLRTVRLDSMSQSYDKFSALKSFHCF